MRVKTFHGPSSASVMEQIRKEMGDEAVILSNKTVKKDGKRLYEIMAAVETEAVAESKKQPIPSLRSDDSPAGWKYMHEEWQELKEHLFAVMRPQIDMSLLNPKQRMVLEYLEKEGVGSSIISEIWQRMRSHPNEKTLTLLKSIVDTKSWTATNWKEKFHILAGPFGSGKTTTALRMALSLQKENPKLKICLANADNGKGRLFLRHYTDLSGFQYKEVFTTESLTELLQSCQEYDKVFIDTPGYGNRENFSKWLETIQNLRQDAQVHLVMNPLYSAKQTQNFIHRFYNSSAASIIWTKIDEACSYGELINQARATGLPISLLCNGNGLQNSLIKADLSKIWKLIFKHEIVSDTIS